jgi:hypothetical protein
VVKPKNEAPPPPVVPAGDTTRATSTDAQWELQTAYEALEKVRARAEAAEKRAETAEQNVATWQARAGRMAGDELCRWVADRDALVAKLEQDAKHHESVALSIMGCSDDRACAKACRDIADQVAALGTGDFAAAAAAEVKP